MTKTTLSFTLIALAITPLQAAKPAAPTVDGELTVRIYNYAGADAATVREAAEIAREIYLRSGVETRWVLCELPGRAGDFDEPCHGTSRADTLRMRIVPQAPKKISGVNVLVYGFALPKKDGFGTAASVFWDKISQSTEISDIAGAELLGYVMAHEAGHLLLGFNSHSAKGLMSGRWDDEQFQQFSQGRAAFIGKQKKRVTAGAAARLAASAADAD